MALGTQETANLEFKREAKDRNAIREAICALANDLPGLGGGHLIIGVDKSGAPMREVDTSDEALLRLTSIRDEGRILDQFRSDKAVVEVSVVSCRVEAGVGTVSA